jgi:PAS domain S-box-containing protein
MALTHELATSSATILQKLAETALSLCRAHSAGLSLLEEGDQRRNFHWRAIAGAWASHVNGGTPRDFGPCGTVLDRNVALVFSHPERDFPYFGEVRPLLEEALLIPFYVAGEALGTIWVVSHDAGRRFDGEDLRVMSNLGVFAAAAYQAVQAFNAGQQMVSIVECSDDAILSKDLNGIITSWNGGAERIFGYVAEEIVGKSVTILIPPELQNEEPAILERIRRGERVDHYQTVRVSKSGRRLNISLTISPVRNADGKIVGASKIARDITEEKRSEAQIAILAREAEHRAKNLLSVVQATVHLTQADTVHDLKQAIEGRIHALANVNELFVKSRWTGAELRSLIMQELAPYCQSGDSRVQINGPDLLLEPAIAQTMAIVLHELATNAAKFGALSVSEGRVQIEWSHSAERQLILRWIETDGPPVKVPTRSGFGTRVMENMIRGQLKGEMCFDWRPAGLACEVAIPA